MNFDPQKLFIGMMDFFSILLPGALLAYLLLDDVGPVVLGDRYATVEGAEAWAAFVFASYLLGHMIFLVGSWLDDFYDFARRFTLNAQVARVAREGRLLPWLGRLLVWIVFKRERNLAVNRVNELKERALSALQAQDTVNAFQWSKVLLNTRSPASFAVVQRFEADSKFFRCFIVVLLILLITWPLHHRWPLEGIAVVLALLLLAVWRYMEQRYKATNQAYWSVITLTAHGGRVAIDPRASADGGPTHADGVVFRRRRGAVEYLLIEAKDDPGRWELPRGRREESEQLRETAVRKVHEDTAVWARIVDDLGTQPIDGHVATAQVFLMQAVGHGFCWEKRRRHVWRALHQPGKDISPATLGILGAAERRVRAEGAQQPRSPK